MPKTALFAITVEVLWAYGTTRVPRAIWQALWRFGAWVEPLLLPYGGG